MPKASRIIDLLYFYKNKTPNHDAVVSLSYTLSYEQLLNLVERQAKKFNELGVSHSSIVGIQCAKDIDHLIFCLAASFLGASSCTIPSYESKKVQNTIVDRCGITHLLNEDMGVWRLHLNNPTAFSPPDASLNEARFLFSTSGTTGDPKLVICHESDLIAQAYRHVDDAYERFVCIATMEHNFSKRHRLYCIAAGATNIFIDKKKPLVSQCHFLNASVMHVSVFQAQELLAIKDINKLSDIKLKLGGSHASLAVRQQLRDKITGNLQAGYGTTETGAIAFTDPSDLQAGESVGRPLPGIEVQVVLDRKPIAKGERGELAVRCKGMFRGYMGKPDLTASRLENDWFYTGDIGYLDNQQRVYLCGRSDDMFVFNSMNIYPQEIESQIRQYPGVIDVVVLPKTSFVHGNIPIALVVFSKETEPNLLALKLFVQERVGIRSPRRFFVVENISRNAAGKISRYDADGLVFKFDQVRDTISQVLILHKNKLSDSLVNAFKNGEKNIPLASLDMDSLARMDLLVALETEHDVIITPQKFDSFRSLDEIVAYSLSQISLYPKKTQNQLWAGTVESSPGEISKPPFIVRFFRRVFRSCHTVAQLNGAFSKLENRLTPIEFELLRDWHRSKQLVRTSTSEKFQTAIFNWFECMARMMSSSGDHKPQPFLFKKISRAILHFIGPGQFSEKTLLICFAPRGGRNLRLPNTVLMQHIDSRLYDLLIVFDPFNSGYHNGIPPFGKSSVKAMKNIAEQDVMSEYKKIRTLGCSAGGYLAIVAGYFLHAEMAVSVGGRFHSKRYLNRFFERVFAILMAINRGDCKRVLVSYGAGNSRDRKFAHFISIVTNVSTVAVDFSDEKVSHLILTQLMERGELAHYLNSTIFAGLNDELVAAKKPGVILSFPALEVRSLSNR